MEGHSLHPQSAACFLAITEKTPCFLYIYGLGISDSGYLAFQKGAHTKGKSTHALQQSAAANTVDPY